MTYEHDREARREAAAHAPSRADLTELAAQVAAKRARLGDRGTEPDAAGRAPGRCGRSSRA
ncbi:hypothetical protein [Actinoplanes auranticolor]|uniref:hypothetical protein n=1 Tax=Actinoplanes auranticolor TaxID=47988 RepID=UPI001BB38980|nr:hypothetical protein [Actinoplanes auranticolor]